MELCERIKIILQENHIKQKDFAKSIGVTESYISAILNKRNKNISLPLAELIEEKYGINSEWLLHGTGNKIKQFSKNNSLTYFQKKIIEHIEKMDNNQIKSVLAFINSLQQIENAINNTQQIEIIKNNIVNCNDDFNI